MISRQIKPATAKSGHCSPAGSECCKADKTEGCDEYYQNRKGERQRGGALVSRIQAVERVADRSIGKGVARVEVPVDRGDGRHFGRQSAGIGIDRVISVVACADVCTV